ncbi:hypothetical protein C9374_001851 [Naegleria lovaniensis]|uniref:DUF2207 domain-containing protein n=1 Tax=Naegleria lovaniensis TaxID=51637 RepID=A0AA88KMS4_NAELO|nr:uncharacterized protein C9374_001851 [Naegleria lovaniensis]KAG2386816.1 hypothetical protein C9374_001851 [Naegleria lovaniensis]
MSLRSSGGANQHHHDQQHQDHHVTDSKPSVRLERFFSSNNISIDRRESNHDVSSCRCNNTNNNNHSNHTSEPLYHQSQVLGLSTDRRRRRLPPRGDFRNSNSEQPNALNSFRINTMMKMNETDSTRPFTLFSRSLSWSIKRALTSPSLCIPRLPPKQQQPWIWRILMNFSCQFLFLILVLLMISQHDGPSTVLAASSTPTYSISRFHSELKLTDSNQCMVEVNEIVTYLFATPTRKISRYIPTNLPYGYARMIGEIHVTSMSNQVKISDILYLKSGDGMKQIFVSFENPTSETTQVTLQYKYMINGPLFVSHNVSRVAWSIGYEEAQSINNIEISVKFPTNMFSKIASTLKGFKVKQDGPETTATFPTSSITSPAGSYRPMFTANNLLFDTCQTYWYTNRPFLTIFGFYGITLAIMFVCLAVKIIHDNIESYKLEKAMERERHSRYARHQLHEVSYDSNSDHEENHTFLTREKKHAFDNL